MSTKKLTALLSKSNLLRLQRCKFNNQAPSHFESLTLPEPSPRFKLLCVMTGLTITASSWFMLQENLMFGTVAGITAKTATAPLERLTTHRQASIDSKHPIIGVAKEIYHVEGVRGFWRGNGLNAFRASIQKGALFALNDFFRSMAETQLSAHESTAHLAQSPITSFVCGSLAGITSTAITYPLDPVKTVNQATIHKHKWHAMTVWYSLTQTKGYITGPWTAALPTFIGTTLYYGIKFLAFEEYTKVIDRMNDRHDLSIPTDLRNGCAGFVSGITGNMITYPNNCVRKRLQTAHVLNAMQIPSKYAAQSYVNTVRTLLSEGGVARLYRGFFINIVRNGPNSAIQFVVYKRLQTLWLQSQSDTFIP